MSLQLQRITHKDSRLLLQIEPLYESLFPAEERRNTQQLAKILINPEMMLYAAIEEHWTVGFAIYWQLGNFSYIEHLAIDENHQSKGYGSDILTQIKNNNENPLILEVELPGSELQQKRIDFYRKHGFHLYEKYAYHQPSYDGKKQPIPMLLMSDYPTFTVDELNFYSRKIKYLVYQRFYH